MDKHTDNLRQMKKGIDPGNKQRDFDKMVRGYARGYTRAEYFYNKYLVVASDDYKKFLDWAIKFEKVGRMCVTHEKWIKLVDEERKLTEQIANTDPQKLREQDAEYRPNRNERRGNFVKRI